MTTLHMWRTGAWREVGKSDTSDPGPEPTPDPDQTNDAVGEPATSTVEARLLTDSNVLFIGTFESADWTTKWGVTVSGFTENETVNTFSGVSQNGKVLKVITPANQRYGNHRICNLTSIGMPEVEEAYFRYSVYFPSDYVWANGSTKVHGKLPGLAGKANSPDWAVPGGGKRYNGSTELLTTDVINQADCFSARLLFHNDRGLKDYIYCPSPYGTVTTSPQRVYGAHTWALNADGSKMQFNVGWNTVEQRVKLNTPGSSNGIHEVWMNGVKGLSRTNVQWRGPDRSAVKINRIWLTWFYGGPANEFPSTDSTVYFDDFVVSRAYIGPRSD